ncbi:MAG: YggS family pyridoxal phosphate-dependent enzyme [Phycisphaerales bacterium]|nr:YggS family pyridoxal phosphate-dependent enzyme [Phycisphaerales bacterium]
MQEAVASVEPMDLTLRERYDAIRQRIATAAIRAGRKPEHIMLVVVTKSATPEQIRELISYGHQDFGESRVQQLIQRAAQIDEYLIRLRELRGSATEIRWHMIGSIQRNKVRKAVELSRLIHSVDSLRLAEEIHIQSARREQPIDVLLEVNVAGEASKHGITGAAVRHVVAQLDTMVNLRVRGLMCMAPLVGGAAVASQTFERAAELFRELRQSGVGGSCFDLLSMGMSGDFEQAIAAGANIVRVGSAIIGASDIDASPESGLP